MELTLAMGRRNQREQLLVVRDAHQIITPKKTTRQSFAGTHQDALRVESSIPRCSMGLNATVRGNGTWTVDARRNG